MKRTGRAPEDLPTIQQLEAERNRLRSKNRYNRTLRSTVAILVVVAALAVLVATLWMPVLRIYGTSMFPTLTDGQVVITVKTGHFRSGDIAAFYHGKAYGETNIGLPYQVPDDRYFLMGDNREVSVDSRNTTVGCVARDQIVGKVVFRIWPLKDFGPVG